jgi:hypothetical protein
VSIDFQIYFWLWMVALMIVCAVCLSWIHFGFPHWKIWRQKRAIKQRDAAMRKFCMTPFYPQGRPVSTREAFEDRRGVMR